MTPDPTLVLVAEKYRAIEKLRAEQRALQAELIRSCLHHLRMGIPEHYRCEVYTGKNVTRQNTVKAWAALAELADMLDNENKEPSE